MATCTGTTGALGTCTETGFVKQTTTEAPIAITCEAEGTVNKYVNCAEGTYTATGTVKACTRCDSRYKLVSGDCV